jgi:hypothetical protein
MRLCHNETPASSHAIVGYAVDLPARVRAFVDFAATYMAAKRSVR